MFKAEQIFTGYLLYLSRHMYYTPTLATLHCKETYYCFHSYDLEIKIFNFSFRWKQLYGRPWRSYDEMLLTLPTLLRSLT